LRPPEQAGIASLQDDIVVGIANRTEDGLFGVVGCAAAQCLSLWQANNHLSKPFPRRARWSGSHPVHHG